MFDLLPLTPIATVTVTTSRAESAPAVFDTGLLIIKDASFAAAKRLRSYANSAEAAAGLIADGFAATTEAYKAAQKYFAASPSPARLLVSCYPASESPVEALDAVLDLTSDFYGVALADSRTDEEILALDTHLAGLSKPAMLFLALTGTASSIVAEGSLLNQLFTAGSRRCIADRKSVV